MSNTAGMGPMHVGTPMQLTHSAGPVANAVEIQDGNDNWVALPNPNNLQQYQADAAAYQIVAADNAAHAAQLNYDASHSSSLATRINDSALATADSNTAYAQTAEANAINGAIADFQANQQAAEAAMAAAAKAAAASQPTVAGSPPTGTAQAPTPVLTGLNTSTTHSAPTAPTTPSNPSGTLVSGAVAVPVHVPEEDLMADKAYVHKNDSAGSVPINDGSKNYVEAAQTPGQAANYLRMAGDYTAAANKNLADAASAGNSAAAQEYDRTAFGQRAEAAAYTQAADNYKTNVANAGAAPAGPTVAGSPPTGTAQAPTPVLTGLNTGTTHSAPAPSHQTTSGGSPVSAINEPSSSVNVSLNGMSHASGVPPYIVKAGDTLTAIAEKYNVPLKELEAANPSIPDPNLIYPGHKVAIPLSIAQSTGGLTGGPGVSVSIAESLKNNPLMGAVNVAEKSPEEGALTGGVSASDKHSTNVHHR